MQQAPSIKKNLLYNTIYQVFTILTPFITAPYLSRTLGPEKLGIQSFTSSVQSYFLLLAALGTQSYGTREIARHRDDISECSRLFWEIEFMTIVTSSLAVFAWLILIVMSSRYQIYYMVMIPYLFASMFNITWFFYGLEKFQVTVIRNIFFQVMEIILMFVFVRSEENLVAYMIILSISKLLSSVSLWSFIPKYTVKVCFRELRILYHFRQTLVYFIPTIATSIYTMLDKTLIGLITNDNFQNGYYEQAEKLIRIAKAISFSAINSVVGVRISYLFAEHKIDEIHIRIENTMNYIFFMGVGSACGIAAIARNFVPIFFGEGYVNVEYLLYIFSPIIVIIGVGNCMGSHYYTPSGRRAQSSKYLIVGSCINLVMNLCLIPKFGAFGAATASVLAEFVISSLYVKNSEQYMTARLLFSIGWKKVVAGICMLVIVFGVGNLLGQSILTLILQILIGLCIYILGLLLLRDDWIKNYLFNFVKKLR